MSVRVLIGDCREVLRTLPDASVQCCVTSPPYYGLRDYGVAGQIGLEQSPDAYVAEMVAVFREVRRVLREDGTLWLNLGDSYASGGRTSRDHDAKLPARHINSRPTDPAGLKPKDLIGIPWMVAFALRADGWWLRSDIIWHKIAPMPESVRDRPTRAHEQVFLLSKCADYFYNQADARDPLKETSIARLTQPSYDEQEGSTRGNGGAKTNGKMKAVAAHFGGRNKSQINDQTRLASGNEWHQDPESGANWRDVWPIAPSGFREAHFATMPPDLAERCIKAGSRGGDTVLDPFGGAGTTGLVADRLSRNATLIEMNPEYADMARRRVTKDAGMFADVA